MESYYYPVIPVNGTTFKEVVEEAARYMQRVSGMTMGPHDVKILTVNMERAMEGTNLQIITVTLNPIKTIEGVEVSDFERQDKIFRRTGNHSGRWEEDRCFHNHSVEALTGGCILEEIDLPEEHELWREDRMPYPLKRNSETIMHTIIIGYVWSQRRSL